MSFTPRTNTDGMDQTPYYSAPWNPYYPSDPMPNCTAYAFGRFAEAGGIIQQPDLSLGNAEDWWTHNDDYERSQTPQLGAVLCLKDGPFSGWGHVCIVEQINQDGSIVTSNSAYSETTPVYFYMETREPPYYNPYGYEFQGFILNPYVNPTPPEPASWIYGNRELSRSEMDNNAIKFYYRASALGASYNAILGMLANIEDESWINPGVWQYFQVGLAYGLVQWDPYTKYSDWAGAGWENNGNKEVERIYYEAQNGLQWFGNDWAPDHGYPVNPPISLAEFWASNLDPKVLADYWVLYYEHPREDLIAGRIAGHQAKVDYYDALLGGGGPTPPTPGGKKIWLLFKAMQILRGFNNL